MSATHTPHLTEVGALPTSGARAVEPFELDGMQLLAIPQLAYDIPGTPAGMNGGDSDTELLLLRRAEGCDTYEPFQTLPAPGGEDAEFFRIGERAFLAVADIRSGKGPYEYTTDSTVFEWDGTRFTPFQSIQGFAAKQWRHFTIGERHFLALAQGVTVPGHEQENQPSRIYTWDGTRFTALQDVDALWGYNWHAFELGGEHFLAYADHVRPSVLLRWNGEKFEHVQDLAPQHGRAFAHFTDARGETYLLVACLASPSQLLRWDGERFVEHQVLDGLGAREFAVLDTEHGLYVVRVNFILGTQAEPVTALDSELYRFAEGRLTSVQSFPTTGATDAAVLRGHDGSLLVAVSNSLTADIRFAARTVLYRFDQ
ncbi:hypothetical protein AB0M61_34495 [Streptomyces sp. NPDC051642]|uniref:hypothetical protein n=1 Tax=Streptomyces sp. NPDC051642 TaxID=3154646 RepID=UPI0034301AF1